jgi:YgiT-type zinc finger domain-containing protein
MKCIMCSGEMIKKTTPYTIDRKDYHLYVKEIPAYVCERCGEIFYDQAEVEAIENMVKTFEKELSKVKGVA